MRRFLRPILVCALAAAMAPASTGLMVVPVDGGRVAAVTGAAAPSGCGQGQCSCCGSVCKCESCCRHEAATPPIHQHAPDSHGRWHAEIRSAGCAGVESGLAFRDAAWKIAPPVELALAGELISTESVIQMNVPTLLPLSLDPPPPRPAPAA